MSSPKVRQRYYYPSGQAYPTDFYNTLIGRIIKYKLEVGQSLSGRVNLNKVHDRV
jgi:hypothetical protein